MSYEILVKVESEEEMHKLFELSQNIWHTVGTTVKPNNEKTKKFFNDNTESF